MSGVERLSPRALRAKLDAREPLVLLDVREPEEFALCRIEGSILVPLGDLASRAGELDPDAATVCICHHGIRSAHAAAALVRAGFTRVANLSGGVEAWATDVEPSMARY